jgi:glycosyltransferase involved in cell wall biosynthesis
VHIAQVVPRGEQPSSGILTVVVHLSAALARRGHEVDVVQLHEWPPEVYAEQQRLLDEAGVRQVPVGATHALGRAAARSIEDRGADVVHLHGAFNPSVTAVSRWLRRPFVFSPHSGYDPVSLSRGRTRKFAYRLLFERGVLSRAARLTALTEVELSQLRAFGAKNPCDVIANGVAAPPTGIDHDRFRASLGISRDQPLAVFVGRLDVQRKGLDILVNGIAAAPDWHLALIGPRFRGLDRLQALEATRSAAPRIHFVGERYGRALQEALAGADVFTLMSRWEGMPMALLEALAAGTPAVVSPAVETLVGVEAAGAGWVADAENLGSLLRRLHASGRLQFRERSRGAVELSRRYPWSGAAEAYERTYLLAQGAR